MTVWIDIDLCDKCNRCITICPYNAIILKNNKIHILEKCTECSSCITHCKKKAILTNNKPRKVPNFKQHKGVWVFIELCPEGKIRDVSLEILDKAKELANSLNQKTTAIIMGYTLSESARVIKNLGVDEIILVDNRILKQYDASSYAAILMKLVKNKNPNIFLFGATYFGRDLAPRVARLVGAGLTADCTNLEIDSKEKILIQTRPAFGGNILATIVNKFSRPQMATVRPGVIKRNNNCNIMQTPDIQHLSFTIQNVATKILETIKKDEPHIELNKAKIIIAGGRGMESSEGFNMLYELASLLNGEVAGTRVAVEKGWISEKKQIGQTGQTVRPNLYIACGISGAIQHRAGIMDSKFIVAINNDPNAAIFKTADWGIIANIFSLLPLLINYITSLSKINKICN